MFVPLWLIFLGSGLVMAVLTVVWAIRSGQFDDQQRARFLPLMGLTAAEMARRPRRARLADRVGMVTIVALGAGALAAALLLTLRQL